MLKLCTKCKETKSLDGFSKDKRKKDGLQGQCKACNAEYTATHKEEITEYMAEYGSKYFQTPAGKASNQRGSAKARIKFPEKEKARNAVSNAIRDGRLDKPAKCSVEDCTTPRVEAHHHLGYAKENWLDVQWLCILHHREADRLEEVSSSIDIAGEAP